MTDVKRSDGSLDRLLIGEIFEPLVRASIIEWSSRSAQARCGKHSGTGLCGMMPPDYYTATVTMTTTY